MVRLAPPNLETSRGSTPPETRRKSNLVLWRLAIAWVLASGIFGNARGASGSEEGRDLVVAGIVAPRNVLRTPRRPSMTKPVVVIIENRGSRPETIPDLVSLQGLVTLEVTSLGAAPTPRLALIPSKKFPITIQPAHKFSVVFTGTFDQFDSSTTSNRFHFAATVHQESLGADSAANAALPSAPPGGSAKSFEISSPRRSGRAQLLDANGAILTASKTRVSLRPGAVASDPITFTVTWPGHPPDFLSEWNCSPFDEKAYETFAPAYDQYVVTAQFGAPGDYTVTTHLDDAHRNGSADPTIDIHVIQVGLQDENGADPNGDKIGVSTVHADRSRTFKAVVNPATQVGQVTVRVSKGANILRVRDLQPNPNDGTVAFHVEGFTTNGSKTPDDCTIEAAVDGKPVGTASVTVIIPKMILSAPTNAPVTVENLGVNKDTSPAWDPIPSYRKSLRTFYNIHVPVTVGDQFGDPIVDTNDVDNPPVYLGAPVFEKFKFRRSYGPPEFINATIGSNSAYDDPVGVSLPIGHDYVVPTGSPQVTAFENAAPAYPLTSTGSTDPTTLQVVVDVFPMSKAFLRHLDLSPGVVKLQQSLISP